MSTRLVIRAAVMCLATLVTASTGCAQSPDSLRARGEALLRSGDYAAARHVLRQLVDTQPRDDAVLELGLAYAQTGDYEEGLTVVDELLERTADAPRLFQARGRLLTALGRYEEAETAYRDALGLQGDLWTAGIDLADLFERTGRARQALQIYSTVYQQYQRGTFRTVPTLRAAGRAAAAMDEFRDANEAYRTAFRLDDQDVENLYEWAELFREKYNDADARRTYEDALRVNPRHAPSLLGIARTMMDFERKEALAQEAVGINPNLVGALSVLAGLRIVDGLYDEAASLARGALDVNPSSVEALAQLASAHHLEGDSAAFAQDERRALAVDASASRFYLALSENAALRFRYEDAAAFAERAVAVDRSDLTARAELGTALLRLGRQAEARRYLQAAFDGDPYNLFASNMLTLLDGYDAFSSLESAHFRLLIHNDERDVLGPAMLEMAEASYDSLRRRYPYDPDQKIQIEAYGSADDFAVRIAGIPHRGLLGVSFGDVVAVNTPRAQTGQPYNWARTLWHELAHTMAMGVSENHVPRWFTEGLSIYEEQRARPEWAREMDLGFYSALDRDVLLPLTEIDRGFTRPSFPGQVQLSYYHAGRVVSYIADTYGFEAVISILKHLRDGQTDDEAIRLATGVDIRRLDALFREKVQAEALASRQALDGLPDVLDNEEAGMTQEAFSGAGGPFFQRLRSAGDELDRGNYDAAEASYRDALSVYEAYTGPGNAYEGLAAVYRAQNDVDALADVLDRYLRLAEHETEAAIELAGIYEDRGQDDRAAALLERALHVIPYDTDVQRLLAETYERMGRNEAAVAHRRAVVALNPGDRAGAYFDLARALSRTARADEAMRSVLQSLEIAPDFRDAQRLLLELAE